MRYSLVLGQIFVIHLFFRISISILLILPISAKAQRPISSIPLHEIKVPHTPKGLVFYLTGDGGWNSFSRNLCTALADKGFSIVALDSKQYFWEAQTPDIFSSDLSIIVKHYLDHWNMKDWILIGYSFGANVAPFTVSRINKKMVLLPKACVLLSPSPSTDFEIKLLDMLQSSSAERKYSVVAEIKKLTCPTLCVYPEEEHALPDIKDPLIRTKYLPGDHRFNNDVPALIESILSFVKLY